MKKIYLIMLTVFLNIGMFSCSPETINEEVSLQQTDGKTDCCGNGGDIPPPPPSP